MTTYLDNDTIIKDVTEEVGDLDEDRTVGPQDAGDNDPSDTTPAEAEELSDEGEKIFKEERLRRENPDQL